MTVFADGFECGASPWSASAGPFRRGQASALLLTARLAFPLFAEDEAKA